MLHLKSLSTKVGTYSQTRDETTKTHAWYHLKSFQKRFEAFHFGHSNCMHGQFQLRVVDLTILYNSRGFRYIFFWTPAGCKGKLLLHARVLAVFSQPNYWPRDKGASELVAGYHEQKHWVFDQLGHSKGEKYTK